MGPATISELLTYTNPIKCAIATMLIPIAMKKHRDIEPSMLQDLKHGKACEIEAINGVVCREGRKYGVKTPINDRIVEVVKEIQEGKRQPGAENIQLFDAVL